jgi:O-antigen/teichoic acid export membrane protein
MKNLINKLPSAVRQAAAYGFALLAAKAVSLAMVPVFTHYLEPSDYGRLDILQTLANALSIIIAFGLSETMFRFAGTDADEDAKRRTAASIFGTATLFGLVSLIATQAAAPWIAAALPGDVTLLQTRLILGSLAVTGIILIPMSWLRMRDRAALYMCASAGYAIIQAGFSAIVLFLGYGIDGVLAAGLGTALALSAILFVHQLRDTGLRFDLANLRRHLRFGGIMVFSGIAAFIMDSFNRWVLADAVGTAELAEYALAAKLGLIAAVACQPFAMWWMPRRFKVLAGDDGAMRCARTTEIGLVIALLAAVSVAGIGPIIITLMTPAEYHGAIQFAPWLAGLACLAASTRLLNTACLSVEKTIWPIVIDGCAAAVALTLYFTMIPIWGAEGAIGATAIALILRIAAFIVVGNRAVHMPFRLVRLSVPLMISIAGLVSIYLSPGMLQPIIIGGLASALIILAALGMGLLPGLPIRERFLTKPANA